ncbi:hypothetical protein HML84_08715 [Alcanivorax sp. IO_7]|nr:hypothetical protein HML84_08715 [Alcanivorax sp. IO_7]
MRFQARDLVLSFLPDWPAATGVRADVLIDGRRLSGTAREGRLLNTDLSGVSVDLPRWTIPASGTS